MQQRSETQSTGAGKEDMFTEERQSQIAECILERGSVSVQELSALFNVSEVTIRKDLDELQKEDMIRRTHGGAVAKYHTLQLAPYQSLIVRQQEEKRRIAAKAMEFIEDGDTILLDGSTTVSELATLLASSTTLQGLVVFTTSIMIAQILNASEQVQVFMIGGMLYNRMGTVQGPVACRQLGELSTDKGFIGVNGIHRSFGYSADRIEEAQMKMSIAHASRQTYILADHTKFHKKYLARIAPPGECFDCLITDRTAGMDYTPYEKQIEICYA